MGKTKQIKDLLLKCCWLIRHCMTKGALFLIVAYRIGISPLLGNNCRFYPSCSQYAYDAIVLRGLLVGVGLAFRRILRCHPGHPGGYDPVPPQREPIPNKLTKNPRK